MAQTGVLGIFSLFLHSFFTEKLEGEEKVKAKKSFGLNLQVLMAARRQLSIARIKGMIKSPDFELLFFTITQLQTTVAVPFFATIIFWISPTYDGFLYGFVPQSLRSTPVKLVFASWEYFSIHLVWQNLAFYVDLILWFSTSFRYWLGEIG